jgi:GT2 family glycosyltransferase
MMHPDISVIVATRDRRVLLERCMRAVLGQRTARSYEVVIVNDGATSSLDSLHLEPRVRMIHTNGVGPAEARNAGVESTLAELLLFTDDDALPDAEWLEAAATALESNRDAVGAEGPVFGKPYDVLYEHSVHNERPNAYYTCNVAYRREHFIAEGGFDAGFPWPHCEDIDLGRRIASRGRVLFVAEMRVVHPPRPTTFREIVARGRLIESEWRLHTKHPETRPARWSVRWGPLVRLARRWQRVAFREARVGWSMRRVSRMAALASAQFAVGLYVTLTRWEGKG